MLCINANFKNKKNFKYLLYKSIILIISILLLSKINHTYPLNSKSISNRIMEQNETNSTDDNFTEYISEVFTENIFEDSSNTTGNLAR